MYDVAILSDLRYPGGGAASLAAEVQAQAAAGLTTVLIHVPSPPPRPTRPFRSRIVACLRDGLADLADDDAEITAKVLLIRRPQVFTEEPVVMPRVRAAHTIVVLDRPPGDLAGARERIERCFGPGVVWAPVNGQVRDEVAGWVLPETDWHEIIDVASWPVDSRPWAAVPVVGRHGRPDLARLVAAYPDSPDVKVRLLGAVGRDDARPPASWELVEDGAESPREFLGRLDFFAYFDEAFDRTILEAMASGVPVVLAPHFRATFAEAALYAQPAGLRDLVLRLHKDRPAYEAQAARATSFVTEHFGSASHIARLASLGVLPRGVVPPPRFHAVRPPRRVLLVGDDINRFRAVARHLPAGLEAIVVAGSAGLADAHAAGLLTEYLPAAEDLGAPEDRWTGFVRDRLRHLIDLYGPRAVLVGGVPHDGIAAAIADHPGPRWLWLRPAMWRRGTGGEWAARGALFAGVLEPGEFAAPADEGWTTTARAGVSAVEPITELPIGLPHVDRRPGQTLLCRGVEATLPGFTVVEAGPDDLDEVTLAVSRADYTNFHELLGAGVPTVFVPDPDGADDELSRARFAAAAGVAVCATDDEAAAAALERLADPVAREALSRRCAELPFGNGAADAAAWLAGHCSRRSEVEAGDVR
ncbi:glycosyl transferase [Actinoplanes sp. M2I2]|uniref:glycosyl transferase n=1 Tax=Actinoplanes sp. M2I2 TaxID=1734444 RepID=UPI0020227BC2|nr:glycosyl transferase [Actinoplanes sp. M2I2]